MSRKKEIAPSRGSGIRNAWILGYEHCGRGEVDLSRLMRTEARRKAYEEGYAERYEEEQQLTNQCEEQENVR